MNDSTTHPWQRAASFAARYHHGQLRKDGRTPYIAHPFRVAMIVRELFDVRDPVALTAALLHDTIEDTTADYDDILKEFGVDVADVVAALTKDMRKRDDLREAEYDRDLAAAPWQARLVKLADVYDNLSDCANDSMCKKAISKAQRAIDLAKDDMRLELAVREVRALMERCKSGGSQSS